MSPGSPWHLGAAAAQSSQGTRRAEYVITLLSSSCLPGGGQRKGGSAGLVWGCGCVWGCAGAPAFNKKGDCYTRPVLPRPSGSGSPRTHIQPPRRLKVDTAPPCPPLTGEALEEAAEGPPRGDEGPEAGAQGDDEDGAQAGLVAGVQERLRGKNHVRNITCPPNHCKGKRLSLAQTPA